MTTQDENEFWKCLRCNRFLLDNTSTVKRYHNVKCLSTTLAKTSRFLRVTEQTLQGFEKACFSSLEIKLKQFTDSDIAKACEQLKESKHTFRRKTRRTNTHLVQINYLQPRRSNLAAKERLKAITNDSEQGEHFEKDDDMPPSFSKSKKKKTYDEDYKLMMKSRKYEKSNHLEPQIRPPADSHFYISREVNSRFKKYTSKGNSRRNKYSYTHTYKPPKKVACDICGRVVGLPYLQGHKDSFHNHNPKKPYKNTGIVCVICKREFSKREALKAHFVRLHMETSPYSCKMAECDFVGGQYFHLERHVRLHILGSKETKCHDCGKIYVSRHDCKINSKTRWNRKMENYTNLIRVKRVKLDELFKTSQSQPKPDVINVELERVHFMDKIINTENDSVHIKGEKLDPTYESQEWMGDIKEEKQPNENYSVELNSNDDADSFKMEETSEDTMSETTIRNIIRKQISSWNSKIRSAGYLTECIRNDPVYQKLLKEQPEFCQLLLRGSRMVEYRKSALLPTPTYKCSVCSDTFDRKWTLEKHVNSQACQLRATGRSKTGKEVSQTQLQNGNAVSLATTFSDLVGSETLTKNTNVVSLICLACGYQSTSSKDLKHHMKTSLNHTSEYFRDRKHQCIRCGSWFKSLEKLNDHITRIHLAKRDFKCELCPKAFTAEKNLKTHIDLVHSNKRMHICKICNRKFRVLESCQKHEETCESNQTRPKCHACEETFGNKTSLRRHVIRFHTTTDPFNVSTSQSNSTNQQNEAEMNSILNPNETEIDTESSLILGI